MRLSNKILSVFLVPTLFLSAETNSKGYEEIQDKNTLKILTPSLSHRRFAKMQLENGLMVLLVSDKDARKSAAALCVHSGTWSDPSEYPGMAHFLEHMLFMGTKAYPDENDFMKYVGDHGGQTNAFTAPDRTVYSFTINNESFDKGLDRFSHFFIDPLFQTSGVQRELHAVDQEHAKNIRTDSRRKWMVFKETGNQHHPNKNFGTGNAETLGHIPREALISWYQQHYVAQNMFMVIYSDQPIEKLKDLIVKDFSEIPHHKGASQPEYGPLSSSIQTGHITYIKPIKDLKVLSLSWELPRHYGTDLETKSAEVIAYTLKNGSENSLTELLKRKLLAEGLDASVSEISTENKFLNITVSLTKEGVKEIDTVIKYCFEAINGLKKTGVPKYIFNEMNTMDRINYEYQGREDPFEFVTDAAYQLASEPLATFPMKTIVATQYSPQDVHSILDMLSPQNCIFYVLASPELTGIQPDKKEKWNGAEYSIRKVGDSYLKAWAQVKGGKEIGLPLENPYIPKHLTLVNSKTTEKAEDPYMLSHNEYGKSYVWEDTLYEVPEIVFQIGVKSPLVGTNVKSYASAQMLMKVFSQKLSPLLSVARAAGLTARLSFSDLKLILSVGGYSENADAFLKDLLIRLKALEVSAKEFGIYKESLISSFENTDKAQPYLQGAKILSNILYNDAPLPSQTVEALKNLSYEEFTRFAETVFFYMLPREFLLWEPH